MVSLCKIKIIKRFFVVESDVEMPGIGRNAVTSTVGTYKEGADAWTVIINYPFLLFCVQVQLLPRVWRCYHQLVVKRSKIDMFNALYKHYKL